MNRRIFPLVLALSLAPAGLSAAPPPQPPPARPAQAAPAPAPQPAQPPAPAAPAPQPAPQPQPAQPVAPAPQPGAPVPPPPSAVPPPPGAAVPPPPPPAPAPQLPPLPAPSPQSMLDVQVLLDRVSFSPGVIDGKGGSNTKKALSAFQAAHDLPVTGKVDPVTWQNLVAAGGQQTQAYYTIAPPDVAGPFVPQIPEDMDAKAKLPSLGYTSPLELLSEKFHSTPKLLQAMNPGAAFNAAGQVIRVPNVRPPAAEPGASQKPSDVRVVVSKKDWTLTVERGDDILFFAPVTAGSDHDPLPLGQWKVNGVSHNPVFHYNPKLFWDAKPGNDKATIPAGPNNPVGVVWIDLNKEHYGIHGTPEPEKIGKTFSHGCVRLTNWDAMTVASFVKPGTPVLFE